MLMQFSVNYPDEYITSVEGTYAYPYWNVITSLVFRTSIGRTSPTFGNLKFVLANNGQKLVGFHGRSGYAVDALGAHFSTESSWPKKLDAQGGPGGGTWDDGDNNDIRKIYVGRDEACVTAIKFEYVRDGIHKTKAYGIEKEELQEVLTIKTLFLYIILTYFRNCCVLISHALSIQNFIFLYQICSKNIYKNDKLYFNYICFHDF